MHSPLLLLFLAFAAYCTLANSQLLGMYYDYDQGVTLHVCNGPGLQVNFGISFPDNPYFILGFGVGQYAASDITNIVNGTESYILNNAGYSKGYFTFEQINGTRWTGVLTPTVGGLVGSLFTITADQISDFSPEEEFCIRSATFANATIFGKWEWLETKNALFHQTQASFYGYNQTVATNSTFPLSLVQGAVIGCWGYTDRTINREFQGNYTGTVVYGGRGWIGTMQQIGDPDTSSVFFMRVGMSPYETRIVGYYLLPGRNSPAGFQILSNSVTLGNENRCPIVADAGCQSSSESSANGVQGVLMDVIRAVL